jgi:hypothetical protein
MNTTTTIILDDETERAEPEPEPIVNLIGGKSIPEDGGVDTLTVALVG